MTRQVDVIIIGGGIIGCAIARELSRRNIDVLLIERGEIAHGQSGRAWGFVQQQRQHPETLPLLAEANRIWSRLSDELGSDLEWTQQGLMTTADTAELMGRFSEWHGLAHEHGIRSQILSTREVRAFNPDMQGAWVGGLFTPDDGHAEPQRVTRALAKDAQSHGAKILTGADVEAIDIDGGTVRGVRTSNEYVRASTVVLSAGTGSYKLAASAGLHIPNVAVRQTGVEIDPRREISPVVISTPTVTFRQRPGGTVYLARPDDGDFDVNLNSLHHTRRFSPRYLANRMAMRLRFTRPKFEDQSGTDFKAGTTKGQDASSPEPDQEVIDRCRYSFMRLFPHLGNPDVVRAWSGMIDMTPDGLPVLGETAGVAGLVWASGFRDLGFSMGPVVGRVLAQLIDEGTCNYDLSAFRPERLVRSTTRQQKVLA